MSKKTFTRNMIDMNSVVDNKKEGFGYNGDYIPCRIKDQEGRYTIGLFTDSEVEKAIERADKNYETACTICGESSRFFCFIKNLFR